MINIFKYLTTKIKEVFAFRNCAGYSMLELLLASAVGAIVIAGSYTSYVIIAKQYTRVTTFGEVHEGGMPALNVVVRDLRMAGRVALDADMEAVYGAIATPITITDSGDACCDSVAIIYDKSSTERRKVTYFTQARTDPTRNALYMDLETWDDTTSTWTTSIDDSLVTDYVEDFQLEGSDNDTSGNPMIVDVALIIRSKNVTSKTVAYTRPDEVIGNYNFSFNDKYYRDEFTATVNIKNLRE